MDPAPAPAHTPVLKIRLQVLCGAEIAMGPGKADLLAAIAAAGSISGGARALGMSYRRAWLLVDVMNRCWRQPLVATSPGAAQGHGARLTPFGEEVLRCYRALQQRAADLANGDEWRALAAGLRETALARQGDI